MFKSLMLSTLLALSTAALAQAAGAPAPSQTISSGPAKYDAPAPAVTPPATTTGIQDDSMPCVTKPVHDKWKPAAHGGKPAPAICKPGPAPTQ